MATWAFDNRSLMTSYAGAASLPSRQSYRYPPRAGSQDDIVQGQGNVRNISSLRNTDACHEEKAVARDWV